MIELKCPHCGGEVTALRYIKTFIFHEGKRVSAGWEWQPDCCDAKFLDAELIFKAEELSPHMFACSLESSNGEVLFSWLDEAEVDING